MKKLLFYSDTPLLGGAEQHMLTLARFLSTDDYAVTLACSSYQRLNPWCQQFLENNMDVIRLKVAHKHDPRHYFYLKKLLPHFDILHVHAWNPASGRYALACAKKIPTVVTEHDPFELKGVKKWLKEKLTMHIRKVIVVSQGARDAVVQTHPSLAEKTVVIHNGIDGAAWEAGLEEGDRMGIRQKEFACEGPEKVVLCVAELHERKGQKYLLEAARTLQKDIPNVKYIFVGAGPARYEYEKYARQHGINALFLGWKKDISELMKAADLFVLPSVREAFGLVLLEAGLSGLPVIASNVGGIPEVIRDCEDGILTPPGDSEKIAAAMREFLTQPTRAKKYAQNLTERVHEEFSAGKMAEKTAQVYRDLN